MKYPRKVEKLSLVWHQETADTFVIQSKCQVHVTWFICNPMKMSDYMSHDKCGRRWPFDPTEQRNVHRINLLYQLWPQWTWRMNRKCLFENKCPCLVGMTIIHGMKVSYPKFNKNHCLIDTLNQPCINQKCLRKHWQICITSSFSVSTY